MYFIISTPNGYLDSQTREKMDISQIRTLSERGCHIKVVDQKSGDDVTQAALDHAFGAKPSPLVEHMIKSYTRRLMGTTSPDKIREVFLEISQECENRRPEDARHLKDFAFHVIGTCNLGEEAKSMLSSLFE